MISSRPSSKCHLTNYRSATPSLSPVEAVIPLATNYTKLPANVSEALQQLQREYKDGDLTEQGLVKRQNTIMTPYVTEHVSQRKLLSMAETELADWINNSKMKQMSLDDDMKRLVTFYDSVTIIIFFAVGQLNSGNWSMVHG